MCFVRDRIGLDNLSEVELNAQRIALVKFSVRKRLTRNRNKGNIKVRKCDTMDGAFCCEENLSVVVQVPDIQCVLEAAAMLSWWHATLMMDHGIYVCP